MNNKGSLIFNSVLGVAVIILFVLQFSGGEAKVSEEATEDTETTSIEIETTDEVPTDFAGLKIGYVNSDTVTAKYEFSKQLSKELMAKQTSAENRLRREAEKLQKDAEKFQQGAPIMGPEELERTQAELMQRQQQLQQMEYELSQNLQNKGYKAQNDYVMQTDSYLQQIGKDLGYDYIFGYRTGDLVMYANPKYDITSQVIELLNTQYNADKKAN